MKQKTKWLFIALIALCIFSFKKANAQGYFGMSGTNKGLGVHTGALIKKQVDLSFGFITKLSSNPEKPFMYYAAIGKRFKLREGERALTTLTTSAGISQTYYSRFGPISQTTGHKITETDTTTIYFNMEIGFDYKNIRPFISATRSTFTYFGAGVKVFIVLKQEEDGNRPSKRKVY